MLIGRRTDSVDARATCIYVHSIESYRHNLGCFTSQCLVKQLREANNISDEVIHHLTNGNSA